MMQPDLGTSLVMLAIMTGLIFISGISWKIILPLYGSGVALAEYHFLFCYLGSRNSGKVFTCETLSI